KTESGTLNYTRRAHARSCYAAALRANINHRPLKATGRPRTDESYSARQGNPFRLILKLAVYIMPEESHKPSLYERLGGIYSISCVVDDLIDRVMTDARLNANPAVNEAHHKVPPPGFKY